MKGMIELPINNVGIEYDKSHDTLNLKGENYKLKLIDASSGFQSLVPLFLVSRFLSNSIKQSKNSSMSTEEMERFKRGIADIWADSTLSEEQRRAAISVLSSKFNKTAFINIVEEPEQNLFPSSQWQMLQSLLEFNNSTDANKLIITTHSPYLINYLTLAVKAGILKTQIEKENKKEELLNKLTNIISDSSTVNPEEMAIYELNETEGVIKLLESYNGLPSDENFLNRKLEESNELFAQLLEIQQAL
jgi:hypothetical protein